MMLPLFREMRFANAEPFALCELLAYFPRKPLFAVPVYFRSVYLHKSATELLFRDFNQSGFT